MDPSECLREASFLSRTIVGAVLGYDIVMANMFMFSMRSKGLLRNLKVSFWGTEGKKPSLMLLMLCRRERKQIVTVLEL